MSKGLPNSISVMAAAHVPEGKSHGMINIPSFYAEKLSYGPIVQERILQTRIPPLTLSMDFGEIMTYAAAALKKRVSELVVVGQHDIDIFLIARPIGNDREPPCG